MTAYTSPPARSPRPFHASSLMTASKRGRDGFRDEPRLHSLRTSYEILCASIMCRICLLRIAPRVDAPRRRVVAAAVRRGGGRKFDPKSKRNSLATIAAAVKVASRPLPAMWAEPPKPTAAGAQNVSLNGGEVVSAPAAAPAPSRNVADADMGDAGGQERLTISSSPTQWTR